MLPLIAASLAIAFFIMVQMGVFERSKEEGSRERRPRGSQVGRLLDSPKPGRSVEERLEVFEDFIDKLRGPEGNGNSKRDDS